MLNLLDLEQLVAFADYGRLSKAAEHLNISQPTITRTMQRLEEEFGVPLFERSKNRLSMNETGWKAVEHARQLLKDAKHTELSFSELNGHNFLLASRLGFWEDLCHEKMPASRFLVQTDFFALQELIQESSLPCFVTNLSNDRIETLKKRVEIPISDPEARITYYLTFRRKNKTYADIFTRIAGAVGVG